MITYEFLGMITQLVVPTYVYDILLTSIKRICFEQISVFSYANNWLANGVNGICLFSSQPSKYEQTV